jgi:hypothetical protein
MITNFKVNITLALVKLKVCNHTYKSCKITQLLMLEVNLAIIGDNTNDLSTNMQQPVSGTIIEVYNSSQ